MRDLVDIHYPDAETIRVVQDNLSTHSAGALYQTFPAAEARRILRRIEFHYTPKHASWLNMVEIEIGVLRDSASLAGSTTPSDCAAKSPLGNDREMPHAPASNGCSRQKRPAPKWGEPTQTLPMSHNHCAEVLVLAIVNAWRPSFSRLQKVADFGTNPGALGMLTFLPDILSPRPALVVVLHGSLQSAADYDRGAGWSTLADQYGFALLMPEQSRQNNFTRSFNWFQPDDTRRGEGEAHSIMQMVERMVRDHDIDRRRIFVTGLSAGRAMTLAMLASYPDVFAAGAVI